MKMIVVVRLIKSDSTFADLSRHYSMIYLGEDMWIEKAVSRNHANFWQILLMFVYWALFVGFLCAAGFKGASLYIKTVLMPLAYSIFATVCIM